MVGSDKIKQLPKIVAVDFDGTLVEDRFPEIGAPNRELFTLCNLLKQLGVKIILWTCRDNDTPERNLDKAVEYCNRQGLTFDAVNRNIDEVLEIFHNDTRKVYADVYLDDKSVMAGQHPAFWCWRLGIAYEDVFKALRGIPVR